MATDKHDPKEVVSTDTTIAATDNKISRRGLLTKAAMGVPLALTLAQKPAFGAACSISGFQSVNPSGVSAQVNCQRGLSPGAWGNPDAGNGDGSRRDWEKVSAFPNPRQDPAETSRKSRKFKSSAPSTYNDPAATTFESVFKRLPMDQHYQITGDSKTSLHDVLLSNSQPARHATANVLNAVFFKDFGIAKDDVIGLYQAFHDRDSTYRTTTGTDIEMNKFDFIGFFDQYH